jgi:hypothetical protein
MVLIPAFGSIEAKVRFVHNLILGPVVPAEARMNDRFSSRTGAQKFPLLQQFRAASTLRTNLSLLLWAQSRL